MTADSERGREERAISAFPHSTQGPYVSLNLVYKRLADYARDKKLHLKTPSRERYIKDRGNYYWELLKTSAFRSFPQM